MISGFCSISAGARHRSGFRHGLLGRSADLSPLSVAKFRRRECTREIVVRAREYRCQQAQAILWANHAERTENRLLRGRHRFIQSPKPCCPRTCNQNRQKRGHLKSTTIVIHSEFGPPGIALFARDSGRSRRVEAFTVNSSRSPRVDQSCKGVNFRRSMSHGRSLSSATLCALSTLRQLLEV